jgi:hypothetical protein
LKSKLQNFHKITDLLKHKTNQALIFTEGESWTLCWTSWARLWMSWASAGRIGRAEHFADHSTTK